LQERLSKLGVRVYPSEANYLLLESQLPLFDRLLERGILIRHCDNYVGLGQDFYRIAVRTPKENQVLIEALEEICCG
jgi:threonine-phosphate decarboxylase